MLDMREQRNAMLAALRELVTLKDLHNAMRIRMAGGTLIDDKRTIEQLQADYSRRKIRAWAMARMLIDDADKQVSAEE